jgi:ribonuclease HII
MARARTQSRSKLQPNWTISFDRERELQVLGYSRIAGVDEAGRGPLAGPVVAGAVVLPPDFSPADWPLLNDSKQISAASREELFSRITSTLEFGVGVVEPGIIDEINIRQASWRAMQLAVEDLVRRNRIERDRANGVFPPIDYVLVDGLGYGPGPWPYEALVKGDSRSFSIAAASIIAKETRDRMMHELDAKYSGYGFAIHKGYPTPQHLRALKELGPCAIHRKTFAPVKVLCATANEKRTTFLLRAESENTASSARKSD